MSNKKWKDLLLKSSLPLEQIISEKLSELSFYPTGEYNYLRFDEKNIEKTFSVDVSASKFLYEEPEKEDGLWGDLKTLIECKYCHPGIKWVFAPHISNLIIPSIKTFDDFSTQIVPNKDEFYEFDENVSYCHKGVQINPNGLDNRSIKRGLDQLRFAAPHYVIKTLRSEGTNIHEVDSRIIFYCSILVTTADLYVLKKGLGLEDYQTAEEVTDVANKVDYLVSWDDSRDDITNYNSKLFNKHLRHHPKISKKLTEQLKFSKPSFDGESHLFFYLESSFDMINDHVIVVNKDSFDKLMIDILKRTKTVGENRKRIAYLHKNSDRTDFWFDSKPMQE